MTHANPFASNNHIVQTSRGLSVAGTRITLYDILDYVHDGWPPHLIAAWLNLSPDQIRAALAYIEAHRAEVEAQYQQVLRQAEENRAYWESRNRGRLKQIDRLASTSEKASIEARIRLRQEQLGW
jgi:uncharacterized protein (DUF433 family)